MYPELFGQYTRSCMFLRFLIAIGAASAVLAHDIPNDVTVQTFLRPENGRLRLLVRCPLKAMRDINFPERGPGYLDIAKTEVLLPDAATLWISDFLLLYQ